VTVLEEDSESEVFQIVGSTEADTRVGKISLESPISKALLGHRAGESVEVPTPSGKIVFKIQKIE
jgi:transcription elongation factor GreA